VFSCFALSPDHSFKRTHQERRAAELQIVAGGKGPNVTDERRDSAEYPTVAAHRHSASHRAEVESSDVCGCFYCCELFSPAEIEEWIDEVEEGKGGTTALCPRCGIDSVVGSASGYRVHDKSFLQAMKRQWF